MKMWLRYIIILCLWSLVHQSRAGGVDSLHINYVKRIGVNIVSSVLSGNMIYNLDDSGHTVIWDLDRMDTVQLAIDNISDKYTALCRDMKGNIYLADKRHCIFRIDSVDHSISLVMQIRYTIYDLCVNSEGRIYTQSGAVYDPVKNTYWDHFKNHAEGIEYHTSFAGLFDYKTKGNFITPQFCYLDRHDHWWLCASFGEFGGEIEIFDTYHRKVANNKFSGISTGLLSPQSVFEDDNGRIYISSGIQHMGNSGCIYRIDRDRHSAVKIFDDETYCKSVRCDTSRMADFFDHGLFVGPGTYHSADSSIYFATNKEIYKGRLSASGDLSVPSPYLHIRFPSAWAQMAVGSQMAVTALSFASNGKLVMTTLRSGICVYDGTYITFLK